MHMRMMPTLLAQFYNNNQPVGLVRALGDSGSETELVHYDTIAQWYVFSKPAKIVTVGSGEQEVSDVRKIKVELRPWYNRGGRTNLKVTLCTLPQANTWEPIYPDRPIPNNAIEWPLNAPLTVPSFWNPSEVQISLGTEVFATFKVESCGRRVGERIIL